jgi:signal transduction histidine kinase
VRVSKQGEESEADPEAGLAFLALLDQLDEGVLLIDRSDRIRLWNRAYADMLDLPIALFAEGAPVLPLIRLLADRGDYGPGDPAKLVDAIAANVRARLSAEGERQMANGTIIAAHWIALDNGYFLFRLRDVTSERNASRFKDEMISTVSHELRTPLTVISGALGLLRSRGGGDEAAELIEVAYRNSERLGLLVNDLLDIDKLQSGSASFRFAPEDMRELIAASVEQNRRYADGLGVAIDLELPDEPVTAEVDRGRLLQVMSNLISNAAKFSGAGSRARVRLTRPTDAVRISVIDKGRGMSEEFRRRLFTRFAQENRATEHGQIGTGLGLAICKGIVDGHGGQIIVDTQEGVGTIFHVDLPLTR